MGFHLVRSTDVGAPTLSGTAGDLITVLDYCLVTTAGWTKLYSGTNKAAYQYTGSHPILRVNDTGSINARIASFRAFESMTDVDTGINPFPTVAQLVNGTYALKSTLLSSSTRPWNFFTKDGSFYFNTRPDATTTGKSYTFFFGEFIKYKSTDTHNFALIGQTATDNATYLQHGLNTCSTESKFVKRKLDGVTTSAAFNFLVSGYYLGDIVGTPSSVLLTYPNPADGGLYISPVEVHYDNSICGRIPGLYWPRHDEINSFIEGDIFSATINGQARTFEFVNSWQDFNRRPLIIETSDTWLI